jgi:hypothetical protein
MRQRRKSIRTTACAIVVYRAKASDLSNRKRYRHGRDAFSHLSA